MLIFALPGYFRIFSGEGPLKIFLRILIGLGLVILALGAGFVAWGSTPAVPQPEALQSLQDSQVVSVVVDNWAVFRPRDRDVDTGFILYPGGRVDYRAYAPLAAAIAERGFMVVITPMPLSLAVFNPGEAQNVIQAYPEIQTWAVGGHSLGGAMAANFAARNPGRVSGLVLWASYPASSDSLADQDIAVVSVYGTLDGLSTGEKIEASRQLLPPGTIWVAIEGGNHAQFGWYGAQQGDQQASISREQQQAQIVDATANFLSSLNPGALP